MTSATVSEAQALKAAWDALLAAEPKLRIRNAAERLGATEAQLVALGCGTTATRLAGDWKQILLELPSLGPVMALTRNNSAVIEIDGDYKQAEFIGPVMGQVLDDKIDLRLFMNRWHNGFAVVEPIASGPGAGGIRRSLQFFDKDGTAVHKVYLEEGGSVDAFDAIVAKYKSEDQSIAQAVEAYPPAPADLPDDQIDRDGLLTAWGAMRDTHDFFGMLRQYKVGRMQALRLAEGKFVTRVEPSAFRKALEAASATDTHVMFFVGSPGCIEIWSGPVKKTFEMQNWYNVMDPGFNLHVQEDAIQHAFIVEKPTNDGTVTSLEVFDGNNENILLMFGKRKPGLPELESWREIVRGLKAELQPVA